MKRRSGAFLLVLALAAVPALTTAAPPECPRPLQDARYSGLHESPSEEIWEALPHSPTPSVTVYGGDMRDVKAGTVAPIGVEIVEPSGCPEISGDH